MANPPVFLLGVGAQKAGTTWLFQYLRRHPECAMGGIKEIAALEVLYGPPDGKIRRLNNMKRLQDEVASAVMALNRQKEPQNLRELSMMLDQISLELDPGRYMAFFQKRIRDMPNARLVGDITPSYSTFNAQAFSEIRAMIVEAGFTPRVVFLMRDPVERCFSALRMGNRRSNATAEQPVFHAHENFAAKALQPWCIDRTRYDRTITGLEAAFPRNEVFIDFYERFFDTDRIRALTEFLGISFVQPNLDHRSNASPRAAEPDQTEARTVRAYFEPVYAYCAERFGAELIRDLWPWAADFSAADVPAAASTGLRPQAGSANVQGG